MAGGNEIYLGALLKNVYDKLSALEGSDLSGIETKLTALQTSVEQNATNTGKLSTIQADIAAVKTDIATVKADIAKVKKYTSYLGAEAPTDL